MRVLFFAVIVAGVMISAPTRNAKPVRLAQAESDCPPAQKRINLVFIIDRSGSLSNRVDAPPERTSSNGRGQTYNVEIEGVRCALLNPSVIPRDGSVAVGAVLFDGNASVALPLTPPLSSEAQGQAIAAQIETLRCIAIEPPCTSGDTNFDAAITQADQLAQSQPADRRLLIMSTDGEATDSGKGRAASAAFLQQANQNGVAAELDVILMGLDSAELVNNRGTVDRVVVPAPRNEESAPRDPPGAVEVIAKTEDCNGRGAPFESLFESDCQCEVRQFADFTRRALRSNVASHNLTITTAVDPAPSTRVLAGSPLSLRQAIEMANSNGGRTTITFDSSLKGATIQPQVPLPPLTAPDITICGCDRGCAASTPEKVTCPQTSQNNANGCDHMVTIDGQHKLEDGILIRSNRDVVRGLRIVNFSHAGIVVQPVCPSDNTGFNRIELNILGDNSKAGVCVLDPPRDRVFAVTHNIGNAISMNDISGSDTPIDLACDGPTTNDPGDLDEGPNTLLNYPGQFTAETSGNAVTITGKVNIPTVDCASTDQSVVEVFAVTKFHPASGVSVVDAVTFFGKIPLDDKHGGAFSMTFTAGAAHTRVLTGESACSIDGYTATFTDRAGNTSELIPFCTGPPRAKLSPESIEFKRVDPGGEPSRTPESEPFTIENCGCSRLNLSSISIERKGKDVRSGRITNPDDSETGSGFFSVKQINESGEPRPIHIPDNIAIDPGTSKQFRIEFNPVIPRVIVANEEKTSGLFAKDVLPADLMSALSFQRLDSGDLLKLGLTGHVATAVKLIDPGPGAQSNPPKITLERFGDNLFVTFSVFDSNLDVSSVNYEFFKTRDGQCSTSERVPAEIVDTDLGKAIRNRTPRLVTGQSFSVIQRFSGALDNPEAGCVRVTVTDAANNVAMANSLPPTGSARASFAAHSLGRSRGTTIVRPTLKLPSTGGGSRPAISKLAARRLSNGHTTFGPSRVGAVEDRSRIRKGGDR
jgi:hypothetical protein